MITLTRSATTDCLRASWKSCYLECTSASSLTVCFSEFAHSVIQRTRLQCTKASSLTVCFSEFAHSVRQRLRSQCASASSLTVCFSELAHRVLQRVRSQCASASSLTVCFSKFAQRAVHLDIVARKNIIWRSFILLKINKIMFYFQQLLLIMLFLCDNGYMHTTRITGSVKEDQLSGRQGLSVFKTRPTGVQDFKNRITAECRRLTRETFRKSLLHIGWTATVDCSSYILVQCSQLGHRVTSLLTGATLTFHLECSSRNELSRGMSFYASSELQSGAEDTTEARTDTRGSSDRYFPIVQQDIMLDDLECDLRTGKYRSGMALALSTSFGRNMKNNP
ncbi:hypothetical protein J6590_019776 [Homalodisca vitripennis]|nr:hypothetical protein J6590_019776 [Homalodisca vitripennis]